MGRSAEPASRAARAPNATAGRDGASGAVGGSTTVLLARSGGELGIPHRKPVGATEAALPGVAATSDAVALFGRVGVARGFGVGRGPLVATRSAWPVNVTSTAPSVSVRYVRPATLASRSIVAGAGWPYGFPAPADATATFGRAASRNACVLAVFEPWWATLRRSTGGIPRSSSSGSTPSSTSPIRRNRCDPTSPSSTIETLLIDAPPSGGRSGTRFGSGQRTRNRIESSVSRSPVERRPRGGPPFASTWSQAS